jgi:hypothetical protein
MVAPKIKAVWAVTMTDEKTAAGRVAIPANHRKWLGNEGGGDNPRLLHNKSHE